MAIKFGFKEDVDRWYRTQSQNNQWSQMLSGLQRSYALGQSQIERQVIEASGLAKQQGQASVMDLYSQYMTSRQTLGEAGVSDRYKDVISQNIEKGLGSSLKGVYSSTVQELTPQVEMPNIKDNPLFKAYQSQVEGVANIAEAVFSYMDIANGSPYYQGGRLTAEGYIKLKEYINLQESDLTREDLDERVVEKGLLSDYILEKFPNASDADIAEFARMMDVVQSPTYTPEEQKKITKSILGTNSDTQIEVDGQKYSVVLDKKTTQLINELISTKIFGSTKSIEMEKDALSRTIEGTGQTLQYAITNGLVKDGDVVDVGYTFSKDDLKDEKVYFLIKGDKIIPLYSEKVIKYAERSREKVRSM